MITGCGGSSSVAPAPSSSAVTISSIADDMRECAPDLASSVASPLSLWVDGTNGWSGHVQYGVLKKHFDSTSGSESIYATVLMVDQTLSDVISTLPASVWTSEGTQTEGGITVNYALVDDNVTLPAIFGGTTVSDFENHMTFSDNTGYTSSLYYKPAGEDGIEKVLSYFENGDETGVIYATRNSTTHDVTVWIASHNAEGAIPAAGSEHANEEFRCLLYFEGNTQAKTFKFKLKTDAAYGWAMWGGGSTATDDSYIAVRGTDLADSQVYANDGASVTDDSSDTYYVILTFGQMKDNTFDGNGYPKTGTAALMGAETDPSVGFILLGDEDCLYENIDAVRAFLYPEESIELFPGTT